MEPIEILYGIIYFIVQVWMIQFMHDTATFKSWDIVIKNHHERRAANTHSLFNSSNEEILEYFIQSNLRIQLFGKSNLDMENLGYDMWVEKTWGIKFQ